MDVETIKMLIKKAEKKLDEALRIGQPYTNEYYNKLRAVITYLENELKDELLLRMRK